MYLHAYAETPLSTDFEAFPAIATGVYLKTWMHAYTTGLEAITASVRRVS